MDIPFQEVAPTSPCADMKYSTDLLAPMKTAVGPVFLVLTLAVIVARKQENFEALTRFTFSPVFKRQTQILVNSGIEAGKMNASFSMPD